MRRELPAGVAVLAACLASSWALPASAQAPPDEAPVFRDGSIGAAPAGAVQPGIDALGQLADYLIGADLGQQVGGNLFHSFERFSIRIGETATFTGPASIDNVLARVTGGEISRIDGVLRSEIPDADLYLINPAGVMFGPEASLDVGGSFHATTADHLVFEGGGSFSASQPETSVLSVSAPADFGFLPTNSSELVVKGASLRPANGGDLSLVGSTVHIVGGSLGASGFGAERGSVDIAGDHVEFSPSVLLSDASVQGTVLVVGPIFGVFATNLRLSGDAVTLLPSADAIFGDVEIVAREVSFGLVDDPRSFPAGLSFVNLRIEAADSIESAVPLGGRQDSVLSIDSPIILLTSDLPFPVFLAHQVLLTGDEVTIRGPVQGVEAFLADGAVAPGRIDIRASERFVLDGASVSVDGDFFPAGSLGITAGRMELRNGAIVSANARDSSPAAGRMEIRADELTLSGSRPGPRAGAPDVRSAIQAIGEEGAAGSILVQARRVRLEDGATIVARGTAAGGHDPNVSLEVAEAVEVAGSPDARSSIFSFDLEDPGVAISTGWLVVDGGTVGRPVPVTVLSPEQQNDGTLVLVPETLDPPASGGTTRIAANRVAVRGGGVIEGSTESQLPGGLIDIQARASVEVAGSDASGEPSRIETRTGGSGAGGEVRIATAALEVTEGGRINARTEGDGSAGNILLSVDRLLIRNGGEIGGSAAGLSTAGGISIDAKDVVQIRRGSLTTDAGAGAGGNIVIRANRLVHLSNGEISAKVGDGIGGNVEIDPVLVLLEDSRIRADAGLPGGRGGRIAISADLVLASVRGRPVPPETVLDASAPGGPQFGGTVEISSPEVDIAGSLASLPESPLDASSFLRDACAARGGDAGGRFAVLGRDGSPAGPGGPLGATMHGAMRGGEPEARPPMLR